MRRRLSLVIAAAATAAAAIPAYALAPIGTSSPQVVPGAVTDSTSVAFQGGFQNPTPIPFEVSNPDPTVCALNCQQFRIQVATSSPFLVSIRNTFPGFNNGDGLNLYVYDSSGNQVASANGVGSNGQALEITTGRGTYTVAVTETYAEDPAVNYQGEARVMSPVSWDTSQCTPQCLPQLTILPPSDVKVDGVPPVASTPLGFPFPVDASTGNSCYLDETANTGAQRCLRFTSDVRNSGLGKLELQLPWITSSGSSGFVPNQCEATQIITNADGSTTTHDAGPCEFHAEHGHFHYDGFAGFSLHSVNPDGTTGPVVGKSLKESFCLADDDYFGFGTAGPNGPRNYAGQPDCSLAEQQNSNGAFVDMGLSPGWGDVYTWDTPDQYIDITNVPPGTYDIVAQANPAGLLAVAGTPSPCAATRITLTADSVQTGSSFTPTVCP